MKRILIIVNLFLCFSGIAQLNIGDKAQPFVLQVQQNSQQSFVMPYLNRIVLLHFWSSSFSKSKANNKTLNRLAGRYKNTLYRNAEGFEVIAVAVQSDKKAWNESIAADSLTNFINTIAVRGYNDDVCKKYNITQLPNDILIDEYGTVISINPRMRDLENILDERKNFQPVKKDVIGYLALESNKNELFKYTNLYLFDAYGDSVALSNTNDKGKFTFHDVKLNQDFILKVDNKVNLTTSDPMALYTNYGELIALGKNNDKGTVFFIPSNMSFKLTEDAQSDQSLNGDIKQISVVKNLVFKNNGKELTIKDETELNAIVQILAKNKNLRADLYTHTDEKADAKAAMELTTNQAETVKNYLIKKGIVANRLNSVAKGNREPRKSCKAVSECKEEDHKINRRVEFLIYKN